MRILSLYAAKNSHGNDAVGAFIPQSIHFAKRRKAAGDTVASVAFDPLLPMAERRKAFLGAIRSADPFDAFVYFGHGLRTGLPSAGIGQADIPELASVIAGKASSRLVVVLYACSTAGAPGKDRDALDGDGGAADRLRDRLATPGRTGWVDAHTIPGHATINRYCRRFVLDDGPGVGGGWIVVPGSPEWKAWGEKLKADQDFRFGFPFMTVDEIRSVLR